jgi:microcystin-dependent protein
MAEPIKISTKGGSLTCSEYDQNLDILRDRSNHIGTQSCNTLNDFDNCLSTSDTVEDINTSINQNTTRIVNLENTLSASGSIAGDLNTLEASLRADINQNNASIINLETDVDNLTVRVDGVESNLTSLNNVVTLNNTTLTNSINGVINTNNSQNTRLTNVENRATSIAASVLTESGIRQSAVNDLQAQIDTSETNRINADSGLQNNIDAEETARILSDVSLNALLISKEDILNDKITVEKNARISADAALQTQITAITNSISTAIPTATVLTYLGNFNTVPTGYLLCAGAAVSRTTYATLFNLIGTRYGVGNGTTTFNLPDFRDKTIYGSFNGTLDAVATTIGTNTKPIQIANLPSHNHSVTTSNHTHSVDITHDHTLTIQPHNHNAGTIGAHGHSLNPYREVALGGGGEDDRGAELTTVPSGVSANNVYPNTAINNAGGPYIFPTTVNIFSPPWTGSDKTDALTGASATKTAALAGGEILATSSRGSDSPFDVRQASIQVSFIIKT